MASTKPKESLRRTYRYHLYPTSAQSEKIEGWLEKLRWLYNRALVERTNAWKYRKQSVSCFSQMKSLAPLKKDHKPEYAEVHSQVLQEALRRLDKSFFAFFRRIRENRELGYRKHKRLGYPRLKTNPNRYRSFAYPQAAAFTVSVDGKRIRLAGIGNVKLKYHRQMEGLPKSATIVRYPSGKWYVCISCELGEIPAVNRDAKVSGFDLGLTSYAVASDGKITEPLRATRRAAKKLRKEQRRLSRCKKGSRRRDKQRRKVARVHEKVKDQRRDFLHKTSRKLVDENEGLSLERLQISNMLRNRNLAKAIADAGWYTFRQMAAYKAESAGRPFVLVEPRGTTTKCSRCHTHVPKTLAERVHYCPVCGLKLPRDHNAAINIEDDGNAILEESNEGRAGTVLTAEGDSLSADARGEDATTGCHDGVRQVASPKREAHHL